MHCLTLRWIAISTLRMDCYVYTYAGVLLPSDSSTSILALGSFPLCLLCASLRMSVVAVRMGSCYGQDESRCGEGGHCYA